MDRSYRKTNFFLHVCFSLHLEPSYRAPLHVAICLNISIQYSLAFVRISSATPQYLWVLPGSMPAVARKKLSTSPSKLHSKHASLIGDPARRRHLQFPNDHASSALVSPGCVFVLPLTCITRTNLPISILRLQTDKN